MFLLQQHQIYCENLQYVGNEIFKCHFQDKVIRPIPTIQDLSNVKVLK